MLCHPHLPISNTEGSQISIPSEEDEDSGFCLSASYPHTEILCCEALARPLVAHEVHHEGAVVRGNSISRPGGAHVQTRAPQMARHL